MRSQYLFIFSILLLSVYILTLLSVKNSYQTYEINLEKYIAYDFYLKIKTNNNLSEIQYLNQTFYDYCTKLQWICFYNTTHVVLISPTKIYVFRII